MIERFMEQLLTVSLEGSLLIAIVIILRFIFRKSHSRKWCYFVFLLVAIRLLIPMNVDLSLEKILPVQGVFESSIPAPEEAMRIYENEKAFQNQKKMLENLASDSVREKAYKYIEEAAKWDGEALQILSEMFI